MAALLCLVLLVLELLLLLADELEQRVVLGLVLLELVDDFRAGIDVDVFDEFQVLLAQEAVLPGQFLELVFEGELALQEDRLRLLLLVGDDLELLLLVHQHFLVGLAQLQLVLAVLGVHVLDDLLQALEFQQRLIALEDQSVQFFLVLVQDVHQVLFLSGLRGDLGLVGLTHLQRLLQLALDLLVFPLEPSHCLLCVLQLLLQDHVAVEGLPLALVCPLGLTLEGV